VNSKESASTRVSDVSTVASARRKVRVSSWRATMMAGIRLAGSTLYSERAFRMERTCRDSGGDDGLVTPGWGIGLLALPAQKVPYHLITFGPAHLTSINLGL
jgi:hypothetical protein